MTRARDMADLASSATSLSSNAADLVTLAGSTSDLTSLAADKDILIAQADGYSYRDTVYFASSGTFTKASYPWLRAIRVKCQGAGGGGCGRTSGTANAPGGGGGMYAESFITDIGSLPASVTIVVGSGGAGGPTSGANSLGITNSSNGGDSYFLGPPLVKGPGGYGAAFYDGAFPRDADAAGDFIVAGGGSDASLRGTFTNGQQGGSSFLGPTGRGHEGSSGTPTGTAGPRYGAGGTGAPGIKVGGVGGPGIVIVELYA